MDDFNQILANLCNADNDLRSNAEKIYESIAPNEKIQLLFAVICDDSKPDELRQFASILLRKYIFASFEDVAKSVDPNFMEQLKQHILVLVQKDNISTQLRKKVCDIISELSKCYMAEDGKNQWPEVLNFMFNASNSQNAELREICLILINLNPAIFGVDQNKYLDFIKKMLLQRLCEETNDNIKLAALKATASFIIANYNDKGVLKVMSDTIMPMLQILNQQGETSEDTLLSFIDITEKVPQILRPNFNLLMEVCMKIITNNDLEESIRHSAIEIIVTYAESAAGTFRKRGANYLPQLVSHFLLMMTDLEEDESWSTSENDDDEDSDSNRIIGEASLDRLACAIGGKAIFPVAINIISQMLHNPDWKQRYAALMAISALGEGCHKQMLPLLDQIVTAILPHVQDAHPRVRHGVCNAFGQMATDFSPNFQNNCHDKFILNMLLLLEDNQNPRVQAHAAAAFVNFFEDARQKVILSYVDQIVDKFEQLLKFKMDELLKKGTKLVLEQVVVTIAALADLIQENFVTYYDRFMPCLKFIIENANVKELRLLRGKAIECASLIGVAVGSEKFCNDASQIMNILLQTQTGELILEDDDPQLSYMITSWVRICKLLGSKFEPYLPMVMPQVLKTASMTIEMALLDQDQDAYDSNEWKCFNLNSEQNFGIKVSGLDDKATACEILVCYARELKSSFVNYLEETVKILVPLLKFYFHDGVRIAAVQSLPCLLECAKIRGPMYVHEMWTFILPNFMYALEHEYDKDVQYEMLVALSECISILCMSSFNEQQMQELIKLLDSFFVEHFERSLARQEKRNDEDYDDDLEETLLDENENDVQILTKIVDVLHTLFMCYNEKFLPFFNQLMKHIVALAMPDKPVTDQQWAVCVMDDLIEFCGPKCIEYQEIFLPLLSQNLKSPHSELRQAAAYGIGVLAKHGGETFAKYLSETIPVLLALIQDPNSRIDDNIYATENAISAITKIIQFNNSMVDVDALIPCWLNWLPIWEDEEEVIYVYSFLYQLLQSNHPLILGKDNCNVPRIVSIILEIFARSVVEFPSELGQKLISYIKFVNLDNAITSEFPPEQQEVINQINNL